MITFAIRNIRLYFRDRSAVFFSFLSVLITLGIYILFLGENLAASLSTFQQATLFVNTWLLAGICTIAPVTTSMAAMGTLVDDRANSISKDFLAAPIQRTHLAGGYLLGGATASFIMSFATLLLGWGWLVSQGLPVPSASTLLLIVGILLLSTLSASCLSFFFISFFHTSSSFSAASTVLGTLIGFLAGIYLPISSLPTAVQSIIKVFPPSHAAVLLRYTFLQGLAPTMFAGFPDAVQQEVWRELGVRFYLGDTLFPLWGSAVFLAVSGVVFFLLSMYPYAKKTK